VQEDHELDEVRTRLLPERVLAATKKIGHQRADPIGERIRLEIVVQGCNGTSLRD
jgi:hypothetical protein